MAKSKKTGGRRKGTPNKATRDVREAIAKLLQRNTANFGKWLQAVAEGETETTTSTDEEGNETTDEYYVRKPDPGRALQLALDMAEFHIPKLSRTELAGSSDPESSPLALTVNFVRAKPVD